MNLSVLHILSGDLWAGAETQAFLQTSAIRELGAKISLLLFHEGETSARFRDFGFEPIVVPEKIKFPPHIFRALNAIRRARPQIVVTHGYKESFYGAVASLLYRMPLVIVFHGTTENLPGFTGFKARCYNFLERWIARHVAARIIVVTDALRAELGFSDLKKVDVIYNVTEEKKFAKALIFENISPVAAFVGRLAPVKRIDVAIRALKYIPELHLFIAGEGPERASLEAIAAEERLSDRTHFLGFQKNGVSIIKRADVFLLTSDCEGLPTVILEALQSEKPIVSTDLPGVREIAALFPDYPFFFVPRDDPQKTAAAISQALQTRFSPHNTFVEKLRLFTPTAAAENHLKLYRDLLPKQNNSRTAFLSKLVFFLFCFLFPSFAHAESSSAPWIGSSENKVDILETLRWYSQHALGALHPNLSYQIKLPAHSTLLERAEKLEIFSCRINQPGRPALTINPQFVSHLWWPGLPSASNEFLFSPLRYDVREVSSVEKGKSILGDTLTVSFVWRAVSLSEIVSRLELIPDLDITPQNNAPPLRSISEQLGRSETHSVTFAHSQFGYYLPATREPLDSEPCQPK